MANGKRAVGMGRRVRAAVSCTTVHVPIVVAYWEDGGEARMKVKAIHAVIDTALLYYRNSGRSSRRECKPPNDFKGLILVDATVPRSPFR